MAACCSARRSASITRILSVIQSVRWGWGPCVFPPFVARRLQREPVSRIIGHRDFWQARFKIGPAVLDPRPATETLIEAVLDHAARHPRENWRILDLGTGSGAILCSLLQSLPGSVGVGVDISPGACAIARDNLAALGLARRGAHCLRRLDPCLAWSFRCDRFQSALCRERRNRPPGTGGSRSRSAFGPGWRRRRFGGLSRNHPGFA